MDENIGGTDGASLRHSLPHIEGERRKMKKIDG